MDGLRKLYSNIQTRFGRGGLNQFFSAFLEKQCGIFCIFNSISDNS
ncbi:Unknown protein sequence [Pseudomonas syringae pv. cilantro]|uniref:Uncharacterized protein n=1 Tax=Pseudomonas syringae pv. cilantro TaxID=81035 RepID=A0A0N0GCP0_PSESX|nr:Unknown protein sequence [Pseudomonas syringae pv. cilantro]